MRIDLVDVFGARPLKGNPLAVVRGAEGLDGAAMLALTRWLNFSETTFLLPATEAGADYRVRIFYPGGELPFAGHPTLGSCCAWLASGGTPREAGRVVQQCEAGLIEIRQDGGRLAFRAPPLIRSDPLSAGERAEAIRIANVPETAVTAAVHAANGPQWRLLHLRSAADVLAAEPVGRAPLGTDIGLIGPHPAGSDAAFELRAFFANAAGQLVEDPVTGSLNAAAACHLFGSGQVQGAYVAAQGRRVGADGRVHCTVEADGSVWIGGHCAMIASGADLGPVWG